MIVVGNNRIIKENTGRPTHRHDVHPWLILWYRSFSSFSFCFVSSFAPSLFPSPDLSSSLLLFYLFYFIFVFYIIHFDFIYFFKHQLSYICRSVAVWELRADHSQVYIQEGTDVPLSTHLCGRVDSWTYVIREEEKWGEGERRGKLRRGESLTN